MRKKVLVFPCGSEIGLELYRSLWKAKEVILYGGSSVSDHGEFVYENYISDIPTVSDERFILEVNRIVHEYEIDYIIPAHDLVVLKLSEALYRGNLACKLLTSPYETCRICCSKKLTYKKFSTILSAPKLYESPNLITDWPVFLKPDVGCGSRGTAKANTLIETEYYTKRLSDDLLILEYLPGKEYTVDCFTDRYGQMVFCGGRERMRILNGISVRSVPVKNSIFKEMAEIINRSLAFRGMWFFQVKENKDGHLVLMEIAPRIAGAMGLYRNLGINFALMSIYDAEGYDVSVVQNDYHIIFDRALESRFKLDLEYEHVYLDYDDCLVINGAINLQMITFLFQCVNKGIGITLLTRHDKDIVASLRKKRIYKIFDEVIHIDRTQKKSDYIKHRDSIFIDDSFAERIEVKKTKGISVFSPDMIESLL